MTQEIELLALIQCFVFITEAVALFVQHKGNHDCNGLLWWVRGSVILSIGVIFMPLVAVKPLLFLAMIANPLIVLGQIFLYVGVLRFLDKRENIKVLCVLFAVYLVSYYYFMFGDTSISGRTAVTHIILAVISFLTAQALFCKKNRTVVLSEKYTAAVFFLYGLYFSIRALLAMVLPSMQSYSDQATIFIIAFIVPILVSSLWTYGFIIMLNHHLNIENRLEKEKMQLVFNTIPDAATITRLVDGLFIDINEGFTVITGYTRDEVLVGPTTTGNIWNSMEDRNTFLAELKETGTCENQEYLFRKKDGSQFFGMLSARVISIHDVPHIISTIQDISKQKKTEQEIQSLVRQLEKERNIAHHNSITDSLTGVANRRYFDEMLEKEFLRLKRSGAPLSLIMLDVDYFKRYNDTYGHPDGDECLRQIASILGRFVCRPSDIIARYGGEEFVIILPETNLDGAAVLADRIRIAVEGLAIPHAGSDISEYVTASFGVVCVPATEISSTEAMVALVDQAMYEAKNNGRNRIEIADMTSSV